MAKITSTDDEIIKAQICHQVTSLQTQVEEKLKDIELADNKLFLVKNRELKSFLREAASKVPSIN